MIRKLSKRSLWGLSLSLLFLVLSTVSSFAYEYRLISITSEPENDLVHNLILDLDSNGKIEKIVRRSKVDETEYSLNDLKEKEVVVAAYNGRNAILLKCENDCDEERGGLLTLKYLYNGVTQSYHSLRINMQKQEGGDWVAKTEKDEQIKTLRLKSRKAPIVHTVIGVDVMINM